MSGYEVLPMRAELYTPANKISAWVSKKEDNVARDQSKEYQGMWVVEDYALEKKIFSEIWIFHDDDEEGIDRRVLKNNPLQGKWGYRPGVNPSKAEPKDMWFFPPNSARCKIPQEMQEYNHKGTWVKPTYKRDFSQLGSNSSGFINVSGAMKIAKGGKYSVPGRWNVLGYNDDVVRGRPKKQDDDDRTKGLWKIFVRTPSGECFPIFAIPGTKIALCKTKIYDEKEIPVEEQRLSFYDVPLKDEKTLVGSGVRNGDTIDLGPMIVHVRTRQGKKYSFEVDPDELVENLKKMVEKREGTPVNEQRLYFKLKELVDGKPLLHFNIRHKSSIVLGSMMIYVQPLSNTPKIPLDVEPTDTLKSVKVKVKNRIQVPVGSQRLKFKEKEMLNDSKNLLQYKLRHLDVIFMINSESCRESNDQQNPAMTIYIVKEWNNHKVKLKVEPKNTVLDVKKMIKALENIPINEQRLSFNNKSIYNSRTLHQSKIRNKSILHLRKPNNIEEEPPEMNYPATVEIELPDRTKMNIPVTSSIAFSDIKDHIEIMNGIPKSKQRIFFFDNVEDEVKDNASVFSRGINNEHGPIVLKLQKDPDCLQVKTTDGRSFYFDYDPAADTVKDLKRKAAKALGFPLKDFHLIGDDDERIGDDDDMPPDGTILNVASLVIVELPNKTKLKVPLLPKMSFDDVKDIIEEKTGEPKANQRIFFLDTEGNERDDYTPMKKAKIKPGSTLKMRLVPSEPNSMVTVRSPDGRSFYFEFDPANDTVKDLKTKMARQFDVPVNKLPSFLLDDVEVDDNYPISKDTVFHFKRNRLRIELSTGERLMIPTFPMQTIGEIKDVVEEKTGVNKADQRIFHSESDEEIDDDVPLASAKVETGIPLKIVCQRNIKEPKEIEVKDPSGRTFQCVIAPDESGREIKERIAKKIGFPIGGFKLDNKEWKDVDDETSLEEAGFPVRFGGIMEVDPAEVEIELPNSKSMKLKLLPTMTIRNIRELIEVEAPALSTNDIKKRMFFFDGIDELDDDTPFEKLKFENGYKIETQSILMNIHHWNGEKFKLKVHNDWYMDDIRDRICALTGIPPEKQNISFKGEPVKEDLQLTKQGVVQGSTLFLEPMSLRVNVPHREKPMRFVVKPTDTVHDMKRRALEKLEKERIGPMRNYYVMAGGQELNDRETIEKCGIQHDDLLIVEEFKLYIMHWFGKIIHVDGIQRDDTVASLKKQIMRTEDMHVRDQILSLNGKKLKDMNTLEKEGVKHRATLILEPLMCNAKDPEVEKKTVTKMKIKQFKTIRADEIMPVMPDWRKRIFFFDYDDTFDAHIELVIMHWTGESFTLNGILLKMQVSTIKNKIFRAKGIEKKKQKIKFSGRILDDKKTLLQESVSHRSILVLESPIKNRIANPRVTRVSGIDLFGTVPTKVLANINIKVKHWNGETLSLSPAPNYYIDDVKDLISNMKGIPVESIRLWFHGKLADDCMNLKEQNIVEGSILLMEPMRVFLELPKPKKELKSMNVEEDQQASAVRMEISKLSKIPFEWICIMFGGEELDYSKTISENDIKHEDTLKVETYEVRIMDWSGKTFSVKKIGPNSTPRDVKERFSRMSSFSREEQILLFKHQILNDTLTLKNEGIQHKSILILQLLEEKNEVPASVRQKLAFSLYDTSQNVCKNKIGISSSLTISIQHWSGETFNVVSNPMEYIDDLRDEILSSKKIPIDQQRFEFNGQLVSEDKSLGEQGIGNKATLVMKKMKIYISISGTNSMVGIEIDPDEFILDLKKRFRRQSRLSAKFECLLMAGEELSDAKKVSDYRIEDGETLYLDVFRIKILDWNGELSDIDGIHSKSTVDELKARIYLLRAIPSADQLLRVEGGPVIDTLRLEDQGIKHSSIVIIDLAPKSAKDSQLQNSTKAKEKIEDRGISPTRKKDKLDKKKSLRSSKAHSTRSKLSKDSKRNESKPPKRRETSDDPAMDGVVSKTSKLSKVPERTKSKSPKRGEGKSGKLRQPLLKTRSLVSKSSKAAIKSKGKKSEFSRRAKENSDKPAMESTDSMTPELSTDLKRKKLKRLKVTKQKSRESILSMSSAVESLESNLSEKRKLLKKKKGKSVKRKKEKPLNSRIASSDKSTLRVVQ